MRRIFFGTGTLVLGLATLMWAMVPISTLRASHGGGGHASRGHASVGHARGGHAPAHIGSVHYGSRAAPVRFGPTVRAGAVRSEHYAGAASRGAYRNPYREEYSRHFRPGYRSFLMDGAQYYGYDSLPLGYQQVDLNGIPSYLSDGVYYQPYISEGQTVYLVVPNTPPATEPQSANVTVLVPAADAQVWFEDKATTQQGMERLFQSPPLEPNQDFTYTIKARWMENGQAVTRERQVHVQAGQSVTVDFRENTRENVPPPLPDATPRE